MLRSSSLLVRTAQSQSRMIAIAFTFHRFTHGECPIPLICLFFDSSRLGPRPLLSDQLSLSSAVFLPLSCLFLGHRTEHRDHQLELLC